MCRNRKGVEWRQWDDVDNSAGARVGGGESTQDLLPRDVRA